MKISTRVRYGMRLMIALAARKDNIPVDLSEIARQENLSMKYLSQIIIPLKSAGLVISRRGSQGGYILGKSPGEITSKEIYEALDGPLTLLNCLNDPSLCDKTGSCAASILWGRVREAVSLTMSSLTLRDLVEQGRSRQSGPFSYII